MQFPITRVDDCPYGLGDVATLRELTAHEATLVAGGDSFWQEATNFLVNSVTIFSGAGALIGAFMTNGVAGTAAGAAVGAGAGTAFTLGYGFGSYLYNDTGFGPWLLDEIQGGVDDYNLLMYGQLSGYMTTQNSYMGNYGDGYYSDIYGSG
jgi:hypothetical protein